MYKFKYFLRTLLYTALGYFIATAIMIGSLILGLTGVVGFTAIGGTFIVVAGIVCGIAVTSSFMFISMARERKLVCDIDAALDKISSGDLNVQIPLTLHDMGTDRIIAKFNAAIRELNSVAVLKNDFIRNFSHEFKTPICSIKGFSDLLYKDKTLGEHERENYCRIISEESARLSNLANMTLMLGKFDAQSMVVDKEYFYIDEQIEECALQLYTDVERKWLDVQINLAHFQAYASKELIKELWLNLLSNAVKYTGNGGQIEIFTEDKPSEFIVHIRDNGIGISETAKKHIFDPYYQENSSHGTCGIGLGLTISKRIIDLHNWQIEVVSLQSRGSDFAIHIPKNEEFNKTTKHKNV